MLPLEQRQVWLPLKQFAGNAKSVPEFPEAFHKKGFRVRFERSAAISPLLSRFNTLKDGDRPRRFHAFKVLPQNRFQSAKPAVGQNDRFRGGDLKR